MSAESKDPFDSRAPRRIASAIVIAGLALGWSCQPGPAPPDTPVELVTWAWVEDLDAVMLVTEIDEADPWRTHGRLELSWLDPEGKELFRALYNTSQRANPVPPEAFGVFKLEDGSVESAGIEAHMEVSVAGFTLLTDSCTERRDGLLSVAWVIRPPNSLEGPVELRARVLPKGSDSGEWVPVGTLESAEGTWRLVETAPREVAFEGRLPDPFGVMLEEGNAVAALRELESLWAEGGDPRTIETVRTRALNQIRTAGAFEIGDESFLLTDIRYLYEWQLKEPDVLGWRVLIDGDLAAERLLFLAIAAGEEHTEPAREGGEYVMPNIDVAAALGSADPWVVSAALFMARKQDIELDPGDVLERWQGPKPWDKTCSEQALLYLAATPGFDVDGEADLPAEVQALDAVDADGVEIQPWLYLHQDSGTRS